MASRKKKKPSFCQDNTIPHPDLEYVDNFVRNQPALVDLRKRVQRSRHDYTAGCTGAFRDRFDPLAMLEAIEQGTHATVGKEDLQFLVDLIEKKYAANHKFTALGVELSPAGKPMLPGNIRVDLKDGLGIKDALEIVRRRPGYPIVSNNVYGQLELWQKLLLSVVNGIHQYATEPRSRTFDSNPTGFYPTGKDESGIGFTYQELPGVARTYVFIEAAYELILEELFIPPVRVTIGEELAEEYGVGTGVIEVGTNGVTMIRSLLPGEVGQSDHEIRNALETFRERDKVGLHAVSDNITGPVSVKVDGIYLKLIAAKGEAEVRFRNGKRYVTTQKHGCNFNMTAAFELVNFDGTTGLLYPLYVEKYLGNFISLRKDVQDYLRTRFTIKIKFITKLSDEKDFVATSVSSTDGLPIDGIVIHSKYHHYFYKSNNTVDITKFLAERLTQLGVRVDRMSEMKPNLIYEFKTCIDEQGAAIEPLSDGPLIPRSSLTKVMPNKLRNVLEALKSPTTLELKRSHEISHPGQSCEICALI